MGRSWDFTIYSMAVEVFDSANHNWSVVDCLDEGARHWKWKLTGQTLLPVNIISSMLDQVLCIAQSFELWASCLEMLQNQVLPIVWRKRWGNDKEAHFWKVVDVKFYLHLISWLACVVCRISCVSYDEQKGRQYLGKSRCWGKRHNVDTSPGQPGARNAGSDGWGSSALRLFGSDLNRQLGWAASYLEHEDRQRHQVGPESSFESLYQEVDVVDFHKWCVSSNHSCALYEH